jgi:hypothetical protein
MVWVSCYNMRQWHHVSSPDSKYVNYTGNSTTVCYQDGSQTAKFVFCKGRDGSASGLGHHIHSD